jgi:hypothetical protein
MWPLEANGLDVDGVALANQRPVSPGTRSAYGAQTASKARSGDAAMSHATRAQPPHFPPDTEIDGERHRGITLCPSIA